MKDSADDVDGSRRGAIHTAAGRVRGAGYVALSSFVALSWCVFAHPSIGEIDAALHRALDPYRSPAIIGLFSYVTALGSAQWVHLACAALIIRFSVNGMWRWALSALVFVQGGMLANRLLKLLFSRSRPEGVEGDPLVLGFSYPSGHTMNAAALLGFVAWYGWCSAQRPRSKLAAALLAAVLVALVGLSRVILGAHHASDVIAALLEGVAWTAFCISGLDALFGKGALAGESRVGATRRVGGPERL